MELVTVVSFLLDRYIAMNFFFLLPLARQMPVHFFMCFKIFSFSSVFQRHLSMYTVSVNLHEVTGSTEVTFSLSGRNKVEIALILIFMSKDSWKTSQGHDWDFFVVPGAKLLLFFPQMVQICQQIRSHSLVRFVRQQTSELRQPIVNASEAACRKGRHTERKK